MRLGNSKLVAPTRALRNQPRQQVQHAKGRPGAPEHQMESGFMFQAQNLDQKVWFMDEKVWFMDEKVWLMDEKVWLIFTCSDVPPLGLM